MAVPQGTPGPGVGFALLVAFGLGLAGCGSDGPHPSVSKPVLVTGATGRSGELIYGFLKEAGIPTRALVRNADKARDLLKCSACDEAEGIFVGDITQPETLSGATAGAGAMIIATSAVPSCTPSGNCTYPEGGEPIDVDWNGARNLLAAFANATAPELEGPIVLMSTMGTTEPDEFLPGNMAFYKLNFEASLMASGLPFAIVKACGLSDADPKEKELLVGHDDEMDVFPPHVPRGDVARVIVAALQDALFQRAHLRFDVCARKPGPDSHPTTDAELPQLLYDAQYHWGASSQAKGLPAKIARADAVNV